MFGVGKKKKKAQRERERILTTKDWNRNVSSSTFSNFVYIFFDSNGIDHSIDWIRECEWRRDCKKNNRDLEGKKYGSKIYFTIIIMRKLYYLCVTYNQASNMIFSWHTICMHFWFVLGMRGAVWMWTWWNISASRSFEKKSMRACVCLRDWERERENLCMLQRKDLTNAPSTRNRSV